MAHRRSGTHRTSSAEPDDVAPRRPPILAIAAVSLAAAFIVPIVLYAVAFGDPIHPLGPDVFGYIWQTRIAGVVGLADLGTRPGFPVLGATLAGSHAVTRSAAPLVLGPVVAVVLGAAVAALVVLAFRLPAWGLGPIAFTVAVWGGTTHMSTGYLANELSLVCIVVALFLAALPGPVGARRLAGGLAAVTASGLAHPGLLPFYLGVGALWLALSLPRWLGDRRAGLWASSAAPSTFLIVLLLGTALVAVVIFGVIGQRLADVTNLTEGIADFHGRLEEMVGIVGLWVSAVTMLAAVGIVVAWRWRGESSREVTRLGLAWAAVAAAGALLTLARASFPGHRALLMMVPLPAAAGLGIVGVALVVARGTPRAGGTASPKIPRSVGAFAAIAVVLVMCAFVALPGSHRLAALARVPARGDPARLVAAYAATVQPTVPVVVLSNPATERAAPFTWRGRENQVRAYVPSAQTLTTFVVAGVPDGRGGIARPKTGAGGTADAIDESWIPAASALAKGALVVAPKAYTDHRVWERIASDPSRMVTPDLAVVRGPLTVPTVFVAPAQVSGATAVLEGLASLLALGAIGGGFAVSAVWGRRGTVVHALALAPAAGAVAMTLVGIGVTLVGADPAGPAGVAACIGIAAAGYWQARHAWRVSASGVSSRA